MYGDDDDDQNDIRPLSFIASSPEGEQIAQHPAPDPPSTEKQRLPLIRTTSDKTGSPPALAPATNGNSAQKSSTLPSRVPSQRSTTARSSSFESNPKSPISPMSPTLRDMRDDVQYPITNIDNPNDIAQELSNLQALRRMSMDVSNNSDPDLLPFQNMSLMAMPSIAPKGDDEADPSRLLWVPAGVHPELAPTEFKNFVEKRVQSMKRRSSESTLSVDGLDRSDSGGLRRKKSMLSRQIDNAGGHGAEGYVDGAERLERKNSQREPGQGPPELSLDELVKDPSKIVQKLTLESQRQDLGGEASNVDDMPILPVAPGMGLRRSTRTTYRKGGSLKNRQGSLRSDERLPFSKRIAARKTEEEAGGLAANESTAEAPPGYGLTRVQSEPISENFSRPTKPMRRQQTFSKETTPDIDENSQQHDSQQPSQDIATRPQGPNRIPSAETVRTSNPTSPTSPTSQIIETSITEEDSSGAQDMERNRIFPERSSSQRNAVQPVPQPSPAPAEPPARSSKRPNYGQSLQSSSQPPATNRPSQLNRSASASDRTLNDIPQNSSPFAASSATSTESLTFIPTFTSSEDRKPEKKSKRDKSDNEGEKSKPTSWKWFNKSDKSDDKDKKKKDDENRKSKTKAFVEKAHDNVRLDVLQTSIDTALHKGRESLLLDRDVVDSKLEEERKKESSRKSGEQKKEKDGLFASFFGSSKRRSERESSSKKHQVQRSLSPEPAPYRPLRPDVDYHWTRFPILEERAIYRMAHIKLANPRRALYSQVLLSNFMYSYLAKVQAMHPQLQVPQSPQQKRLQEEERQRREQQEQQYMEQQQAQDSIDRYNFEYHRSTTQYGDPSMQHEAGDYPESAEIYDYAHGKDHTSRDNDYNGADEYGTQDADRDYYSTYVQYTSSENGRRQQQQEEDDEMW
ncbi:hypothetical protein F4804DRAFT_39205 [Jackrogersella minutella]|nr:hypothetical protein F4804DRAFT_39205 [Jackrogersella minutella]